MNQGFETQLNHRERFHRIFQFKDVDRVCDYEFGYWDETIDRWHREGLPLEQRDNRGVEKYLGLEGYDCLEFLPVKMGLWPVPPASIIEEWEGRARMNDGMGGIYLCTTDTSSPPHYERFPLKDREDWEKIRHFLDPDTPGRIPLNWGEVAERYRDRDYPVGMDLGSLYGWLRDWMGVKGLSIAFYRDPDWVGEMMDTLTELWITIIRRVLPHVDVDFTEWWEDMCYNRGPLLGVHHFEEFMVPRYRKVVKVMEEYGVKIHFLDCDGDISALVPGWIDAGIRGMYPNEARFTDSFELRERYGEEVLLMGSVNKMALIQGGTAIDQEIERLTPLIEGGGFIPMVDHRCPPEVSYATYQYYLGKKREWIGRTMS
jgi:uroporphyrinogen decarboxylase